jgi:hypothetical protein
MAALADRITALAAMPAAQLRQQWQEVFGGEAPPWSPDLLRRLIAQRLQEKRHGGLPVAVQRELARTAGESASEVSRRPRADLRPGTRFVREWNGRTISVLAVDDGFLWEDRRYPSLSSIAKEVTGAHWSGPRFFGLAQNG